jgi:signal transduction histidine kinase
MRERVYLLGGTLSFDSGADGTLVRAELPLHAAGAERLRSHAAS